MCSFTFLKKERLQNRKDFVNLNKLGKRYHTAHFVVISRKNGLSRTRLGVTVSKKVGNAVKRNRVKRRTREFFRLYKAFFPSSYDIVIAAKKGAYSVDFWKIREELGEILLDKKFRV